MIQVNYAIFTSINNNDTNINNNNDINNNNTVDNNSAIGGRHSHCGGNSVSYPYIAAS